MTENEAIDINEVNKMSEVEIERKVESEKVRRCAYCDKVLSNDSDGAYCCPEHEELRRLYNRDYYVTHKSDLIKKSAVYIKEHPDVKSEINARYYASLTEDQKAERNRKRRNARRKPKIERQIYLENILDRVERRAAGLEVDPKVIGLADVTKLKIDPDIYGEMLSLPLEELIVKQQNKVIQDAIEKTREVRARSKGFMMEGDVPNEEDDEDENDTEVNENQ